jgi:hypothetical protein
MDDFERRLVADYRGLALLFLLLHRSLETDNDGAAFDGMHKVCLVTIFQFWRRRFPCSI